MVANSPPRRLRAILLDMDGTLLDTGSSVPRAYIATVAELTGRVPTPQDVYRVWAAGMVEATLAPLLDRPTTPDDVATYYRHLQESMAQLRAYDGIDEAMVALADRCPLAVVTNASAGSATMSLRASGLDRHLQFVLAADDVSAPKPDPEGILTACERLGVAPADAAYVGDARSDMLAARAAGTLSVAVSWGHAYDATAPADVTVHSPSQLVEHLT